MKRIFCCVLCVILLGLGNVYASSELSFSENFTDFRAAADGTAYPTGMYAQNFEYTDGGAGIYSAYDIYGKCAVIKTTSNRGNTQMAYRFAEPVTETLCFELDLKSEDRNLKRLIQTRYGQTTDTSVNVMTISDSGLVYLGDKVIDGLIWQCSKWYNIKLTINQSDGVAMAEIKSQDGEKYECIADIARCTSVYSVWITHSGTADAVTCVDNWSVRNCNDNQKMAYHGLNSFETRGSVRTDGILTNNMGNGVLLLEEGGYALTDESVDGGIVTYAVDVYLSSTAEADVTVGEDSALKITGDGNLLVNGEKIGKISPKRWYRIYITADTVSNIRYIVVSTDSRLVAEYKDALALCGEFKISVTSGVLYLDNMGVVASGTEVEPVLVNMGVGFAELVYPFFIDKDTVEVYVDGVACIAAMPGTRTVCVKNVKENSTIRVANARDLYGHYINTEVDLHIGDMVNVDFSQDTLQNGGLSVTVGAK